MHAAAAIQLLMLLGCRCNEVLTLLWEDIDLEANEMLLRDSKTGPRAVPLSPAAVKVLSDPPRVADNPWVIAGRVKGRHMKSVSAPWGLVWARADLNDARIHDLRHSFVSRARALGESLPMIGKLLGHARAQTTAPYAHLARESVKEAAARIAASIGEDILRKHAALKPRNSTVIPDDRRVHVDDALCY